ncbi:hypothetical protein WISP_146249 [Willisornis vidua]|uniref:Uncharacterized protein n=1 Tax=Willisornis vidua TaxID=1566151 RepID=A0ABQ9CKQ6_9PASS|nr:hypothetical protein WISP_146249 [Willisornis vidua]
MGYSISHDIMCTIESGWKKEERGDIQSDEKYIETKLNRVSYNVTSKNPKLYMACDIDYHTHEHKLKGLVLPSSQGNYAKATLKLPSLK